MKKIIKKIYIPFRFDWEWGVKISKIRDRELELSNKLRPINNVTS